MRCFFLLPGVLFLGSCVLGPEPGDPETTLPSSVRGDHSPGGESFGDRAWRKVFTDATLRALISRALQNNPDLTAATYRIEEARALAGAANASWYPSLDGSAAASLGHASRNSGLSDGGKTESYSLTALLSWEADLWGGIRRSNQAARARLLAAEYQRDAVQTSLVAAVASAYIDLKNLDERLEIARRTAASRIVSLDLVTTRRDGGVGSELEVGQAGALLRQAQIAIPLTEQAITAKENEIRALLGEYPGAVARGGSLHQLESSLHIAAGLPSSLLERRSDVAAAGLAFQAATADIGVAEALRLPALSLTGRGGLISGDLHNLLDAGSKNFSIGPQLAGPIFDAGRSGFRVKAAQARAKQSLADHQKAAQQAFREAADALNAYQKTSEVITRRSELIASLKSVSSVARQRFQGGNFNYLEVLDAERSLFNAELDLADDRRNHLQAIVQTYRALGGGWK
jgi:multidrug efflux system outer membrane protein